MNGARATNEKMPFPGHRNQRQVRLDEGLKVVGEIIASEQRSGFVEPPPRTKIPSPFFSSRPITVMGTYFTRAEVTAAVARMHGRFKCRDIADILSPGWTFPATKLLARCRDEGLIRHIGRRVWERT